MKAKKFNVTELEERLEFCICPGGFSPIKVKNPPPGTPDTICISRNQWGPSKASPCL